MKKGINIWTFPAGMDIPACMRLAKDAGFDAIELALNLKGPMSPESTEAEIRGYRTLADELGLEIASLATGLYWDFPLTSGDPAIAARALEIARFQLQAAQWLGVHAILLVPGCVGADFAAGNGVVPYDVAYDRAFAAVSSLIPTAEACDVVIGMENVWNKFLLSPLEMRDFVDKFHSPYVQAYFDIGNVLITGYPEHWISILGKRIVRVHCKDFARAVGTLDGFVDLLTGDVNYPAVMQALRDVGYDGYICCELMNGYKDYPVQRVYNASAAMDRFMGR